MKNSSQNNNNIDNNGATRCGFVAVIGAPNVGKSTLVNAFVGAKVSIVSPKVQTTRSRVNGIMVEDNAQVIFTDTPGIFKPNKRFDRAMVQSAWGGLDGADLLMLVLDARKGYDEDAQNIIQKLVKNKRKAVLVLNKIDIAKKKQLLDLSEELFKYGIFDEVFMVSAKKGNGLDTLKNRIIQMMPESPFMYPDNQISDLPQRLFAAEVTREKLFYNLKEELPYALTVETEMWEEKADGSIKINQVIFVKKPGQRSIVLGDNGEMIKKISMAARTEMSHIFGTKIHLFLFVKVRKDWTEDPSRYREWGLDYNA